MINNKKHDNSLDFVLAEGGSSMPLFQAMAAMEVKTQEVCEKTTMARSPVVMETDDLSLNNNQIKIHIDYYISERVVLLMSYPMI
eukprot:CAMPEP_0203635880 /NCGR_PEP_ID=MMETSP0088-20131115/2569_1 /ASSEMBLY_ACC=CAM_ASM_001087 /TAXON_ID=426623 /ORGANISM="Chaetoceros affinis, Strain CCMP159" /LENGTH=84 /DNA_ID=CAMNT_0050489885 /DNA_START=95 /DNA_END=349 /DNA_ORIENTATION=+